MKKFELCLKQLKTDTNSERKKKKKLVAGKAKPHSVLQVACKPVYSKYHKWCLQNLVNLWTGVQRTNQTMFSRQCVRAPTRCSKLGGVILLHTARIAGAKSCKIDKIYQEDVDRTETKLSFLIKFLHENYVSTPFILLNNKVSRFFFFSWRAQTC